MSPLSVAALVSAATGGAVWCFSIGLQRSPRSFRVVRDRMYGTAEQSTRQGGGRTAALAASPVGVRIGDRYGVGLRLIGLSMTDVISRVLAAAGVAAFTTVATVAALSATGLLPLSPWWIVLVLAAAPAAAWSVWGGLRQRMHTAERAMRQTANDFIQLVAVGLTTDQSVEEAIRFALAVGDGPSFSLLRDELQSAPQRGLAPWEALEQLGSTYGLRELGELGTSIERQGTQGVSITDTVSTMATAMRAKALDALERDADQANANLSGPTIGFVVATIVFLGYPLAIRVSEAFGG